MQSGTKKFYAHSYSKLKTVFDSNSYYDIVFVGSSRIHGSINPRIVDSISGFSTFNAGIDGAGIAEFKMLVEGYLSKHPAPKQIILGLDAHSFDNIRKFVRYNLYLYFLNNNTVSAALSQNGYTVFPYNRIPFLKLIEMDDMAKRLALHGLSGKQEIGNSAQYKGFVSGGSGCILPSAGKTTGPDRYAMNEKGLTALASIISECNKRDIGLLLVYAPEYDYKLQGPIQNFDSIMGVIKTMAVGNDLLFLRDDSLEMCREKCFFSNYGHLNGRGAAEYSRIWGDRLKKFQEE